MSDFRAIEGEQLQRVAQKLRNKVGNLEVEKYSVMQNKNVGQLEKLSDRSAKINKNARVLSKQAGQPTATAYGSAQRKYLEKIGTQAKPLPARPVVVTPRTTNPAFIDKQAPKKAGSFLQKIGQKVKALV